MVLPFSTLLFSHVFAAMLGFAAFALLLRERDGPPRPLLLGGGRPGDRLRDHLRVPARLRRRWCSGSTRSRGPTRCGPGRSRCARAPACSAPSSGSCRCCSTTTPRSTPGRTSPTRTSPSSRQGFFGISAPSPRVLVTLLLDSRGLLTLSPVLAMGARRHRAALPARPPRRGADDRRRVRLLSDLQLRLLPAVRRRRARARAS